MDLYLDALFQYAQMVCMATLFAVQDVALIAALPVVERLVDSGRIDALIEKRALVMDAERACKESV